jgi:protease I
VGGDRTPPTRCLSDRLWSPSWAWRSKAESRQNESSTAATRDVHGGDCDAILFLGGAGYKADDPEAWRITQEAVAAGNVVAPICTAPITLAKAGVVNGKRLTAGYLGPKHLEEASDIFAGAPMVRDGFLITANGPGSSRQSGATVAAALGERARTGRRIRHS